MSNSNFGVDLSTDDLTIPPFPSARETVEVRQIDWKNYQKMRLSGQSIVALFYEGRFSACEEDVQVFLKMLSIDLFQWAETIEDEKKTPTRRELESRDGWKKILLALMDFKR